MTYQNTPIMHNPVTEKLKTVDSVQLFFEIKKDDRMVVVASIIGKELRYTHMSIEQFNELPESLMNLFSEIL